jgi:EmrB/QacA subfamily drug resistance transporter
MPATPTISPRARWQGGTAHPSRRRILLVLCLSLLVVVIDNTVLNTALPTLARELHAGTASLQWVTDSYSLVFAAVLISAGALGDRYGRRLALMAGLALFGMGSVGAALSSGTGVLIGWRAVMGLGAAFVMPATLSILNSVFPAKERAQAIAAWSAVAGVGVVIGPTLGGALLAHFAWGSIFWVNVPLVALALVVVLAIVPEIEVGTHRAPLDIIGVASSGLGLLGLVDAVIQAPEQGWTAPRTLGELGLAVAALVGFVVWERRSPAPMLDVRVFANRAFSAASGSIAVVFFALFGSLFALTQYLQLVHGYSTLAAGVRALPFALAMGAVSPLSTVLAKRAGVRVVVPTGLALMAAGLGWLSDVSPATSYAHVAVALVGMGTGMALVMSPASESIMSALPQAQAGIGSAVNDTVREVGGALGVAVVGSLVSACYRSGLVVTGLAPALARAARSSIAAADQVATAAGPAGTRLAAAAHQAFTTAMRDGLEVAAAVAVLGALAAALGLPARRSAPVAGPVVERVAQPVVEMVPDLAVGPDCLAA